METHRHNANPATGAVCSHLLTDETMLALGIVSKTTSTICGSTSVIREGLSGAALRRAIIECESVRMCTPHPAPKANRVQSAESAAASFTVAEAMVRPRDRRER